MHMTASEGAATHLTGWVSKGDLLGCNRSRSVPSFVLGEGLNEQEQHP
jgi:hypothetical protein